MCVLDLGHWERSRKRSTPQCFHHLIDWDATDAEHKRDPNCGNLFLHFLSNLSAHVHYARGQYHSRERERERERSYGAAWLDDSTSSDKTHFCVVLEPILGLVPISITLPAPAPLRGIRRFPCSMLSWRLVLVMSLDVKIGREQACPTTRKLSVSFSESTILPRTTLWYACCSPLLFPPE